MVLPRVITALVMAPLFLWALYLGSLPYLVFIFFVIFLAFWEFQDMARKGGFAHQSWWGLGSGMAVAFSLIFPGLKNGTPFQFQAPALAWMLAVFVLVLREIFRRDKSLSLLRIATSLLGIFLVVWPLGYMILLRELRGGSLADYSLGRDALFLLVVLIWTQDVAAWAAGRAFGKTRLAVQISPKKSWEGAVVGLAAGVLAALILRETWLPRLFSRTETVIVSACLGALAQLSDLSESLIKRSFGLKDSSDLLPGHGGVLDRFDSFIFSTPFLYYYLIAAKQAIR